MEQLSLKYNTEKERKTIGKPKINMPKQIN